MVVLVCYAFGGRRVPDSGSHQPAPPAAAETLSLSLATQRFRDLPETRIVQPGSERRYPSLPSSRSSRSPMSLGTRKTSSFPFFFSSKTPRFARSSRSVRAV